MITPEYAQTFARYNRWQNESLYRAASGLTDAERKDDRGAFFGSIHGTLSHILFGDQIWMSRFAGWPKPIARSIRESAAAIPDWEELKRARVDVDGRLIAWADGLGPEDLAGDLTWYSGAAGREISRPKALLIAHMFNHQTHHRGQVHALLTSFGAKPDDTDLMLLERAGRG